MTVTLVLGGARSGKSVHAERLAQDTGGDLLYIATGEARDAEMAQRIAHHRAQRGPEWTTVEEPLHLAAALAAHAAPGRAIVVDCLTLWLTNLLFAELPGDEPVSLPPLFLEERRQLLDFLRQSPADVVLVSNEVGMGIVPMGAVSRCFVDEAGRLNQAVAAVADRVVFVAAGLPLVLKGPAC